MDGPEERCKKKRKKTDFFCQSESRTDYPVGAWLHPQAVFQMSVCPCVCVCVLWKCLCVLNSAVSRGDALSAPRRLLLSPAFALTHSRALFVAFLRLGSTHRRSRIRDALLQFSHFPPTWAQMRGVCWSWSVELSCDSQTMTLLDFELLEILKFS